MDQGKRAVKSILKRAVRAIVLWAFDGRLPSAPPAGNLQHDPAGLDELARRIRSR
jgi:hypothetical protein